MKRDPQIIAIWLAIAIICFTQIITTRHNYQMHHQLRGQIQQTQEQHLNSLRVMNDNLQNLKDNVQCFSEEKGA